MVKQLIKNIFNLVGLEVQRHQPLSDPVQQIYQAIKKINTDIILDIGANAGQFSLEIRKKMLFFLLVGKFFCLITEYFSIWLVIDIDQIYYFHDDNYCQVLQKINISCFRKISIRNKNIHLILNRTFFPTSKNFFPTGRNFFSNWYKFI